MVNCAVVNLHEANVPSVQSFQMVGGALSRGERVPSVQSFQLAGRFDRWSEALQSAASTGTLDTDPIGKRLSDHTDPKFVNQTYDLTKFRLIYRRRKKRKRNI